MCILLAANLIYINSSDGVDINLDFCCLIASSELCLLHSLHCNEIDFSCLYLTLRVHRRPRGMIHGLVHKYHLQTKMQINSLMFLQIFRNLIPPGNMYGFLKWINTVKFNCSFFGRAVLAWQLPPSLFLFLSCCLGD